MKRLAVVLLAVLMVLSIATLSMAQVTRCISTGLKTSDAIIHTGPAYLCGVEVITNAAADATCIVYGALTTTGGTELFKGLVAAASNFGGATFPIPIYNPTGLYLDITGEGAACVIYYYQGF